MSRGDEAEFKAFWLQYLQGKQSTQLPTVWHSDTTSDSSVQPAYEQTTVSVDHAVTNEVILGAWASVLALYTTTEDISFGVALEGGFEGSSKSTIAFPFCLSLFSDDGPAQVLQHVKASLEQIQGNTHLESDQGAALKQVTSAACHYATLIQIHSSEAGHSTYNADEDVEHISVPLKISFQISESSTNIVIFFQQSLHSSKFIDEILRQTVRAIEKLHEGSGTSSQDVNLNLVLSWTRPCEPVPQESLLHTGIERQSRLSPAAIAVGQSESVMTYRELNLGADLLADSLWTNSSANDKVQNVGIYFEKSSFAIMSMLAVLKAGGTYVPLDVAWPQQRIATVIENADINTVFCSPVQEPRLKDHKLRIVTVDERSIYEMKRKVSNQQHKRREADPADAAYMLYTSGSTGVPKGIPVSHSAITTSIQAMARHLNINAETRTFQYTTFTFDLNIADIWMTLSHGGRICLPTEDERLNVNEFIAQERCNYAMITPTAASTIDKTTLHGNIETLALIGETVPEQLLRGLATSDASLNLYNTWGPTEASVIASSSEKITLKDDSCLSLHPNDVGHPVGSSIFLVSLADPHHLAPAFAPGEIALVGHTLADGYYGNTTKTEEAFRKDLEWTKNEAITAKVGGAAAMKTVYLTGDIGRYNPSGDGSIIFMHRKEGGYVKINGYRVDPGEIESRVSEMGLSRKGVCVLTYEQPDRETEGPRQVLVCFFVAGHGQSKPESGCEVCEPQAETKQAVKQATEKLRDTMPEYMIPRLFVPLESMPILTSHKINRKSLLGVLDNHSWQDLVKQFGG